MPTAAQVIPHVPMQISHGVIIALLQTDLTEAVLQQFQDELLPLVHDTGARGVVFDTSALGVLDNFEFAGLRRVLEMTELLGAQTFISGLSPGIVSSLIDTDADIDGIKATLHSDDAVIQINLGTDEPVAHRDFDEVRNSSQHP